MEVFLQRVEDVMKRNVYVQRSRRLPQSPSSPDLLPNLTSSQPRLRQPFWARDKDGHQNLESYAKGGSSRREVDGEATRSRLSLLWILVYYTILSIWGILVLGYVFVFAGYLYHCFNR